jgi:thioester reductase-like protein
LEEEHNLIGSAHMAGKAVFMTGAGGFLGRYILARYLQRDDCDLFLLENGPFCARLAKFVEAAAPDPAKRARVRILEGDITKPDLGLDAPARDEVRARVTHAIHLAALYNLSAPRDVSVRINVDGTRNVLDFLEGAPGFRLLAHTSTLAVAGTTAGVFSEDEFDRGQGFKNFYEETKFLSEKLVRERLSTVPAIIFRPAVVVGHSKTGEIEKIDGPYYVFVTIARHLHLILPDCGATKCHIAPVDFVTDGFYTLFEHENAAPGTAFHLMDPNPMAYNAFMDLACERWGRHKPLLRLPPRWMKPIAHRAWFEKLTGIPWKAFMYSDQPVEYRIERSTAALAKHGIACPPVSAYIDVLIRYFREHYRDAEVRRERWWEK